MHDGRGARPEVVVFRRDAANRIVIDHPKGRVCSDDGQGRFCNVSGWKGPTAS